MNILIFITYLISYAIILLALKHTPMKFPNKHINIMFTCVMAIFAPIIVLLMVLLNLNLWVKFLVLCTKVLINLIKTGYYKLCR